MAWPQDAYVGQKVVRWKDDGITCIGNPPPVGLKVTISYIGIVKYANETFVVIDLVEYPTPLSYTEHPTWKRGWRASYFYPIQSTFTGFSILACLQDPANHRDLEDVSPNSPVLVP